MNNAAADVEIMPAVVSSIFSLIPSPPAPFFFFFFLGEKKKKEKRHLSCLDARHAGDSWPNKRDLG